MRYIKYYISTFTLILAIKVCFLGEYYPTIFFIGFSLFIILGDILLKKDIKENSYSYTYFLNFPMYINLPLLMIIVLISIGVSVTGSIISASIPISCRHCDALNASTTT